MTLAVYYNEIDPYCAQWLSNLMEAGLIARGDIDTRSIEDVRPTDLRGYTQCHFFAGLGGWPYALDLAGWGARPVWTGSCPCQPFSAAGKGTGFADKRHLWPAWLHLISQQRPAVVFGEQVAAAVGHQWLDGVCADLEGQGYAIGAAVLPACSVGAPHRRDRLWFVADTDTPKRWTIDQMRGRVASEYSVLPRKETTNRSWAGSEAFTRTLADARSTGLAQRERERGVLRTVGGESERQDAANDNRIDSWILGHDGKARRIEPSIRLLAHGVPARVGRLRAYGNAIVPQVAAEVIGAYMDCRPEAA